ncbi:MAG TPA: glycosyltransferase [Thermoanaerobaculia bacterium]|nr:glycosyltransferase [Thermoanaerobaculia bacterium]
MISLLVVNFRSARLAADAIRTARAATSAALQIVIVDNSCEASEAAALNDFADVLIVSETNRGYAGAINDGRRACTGQTMVVANPDVTFAPNAIDLLVAALQNAAVAGPALFWDDAHRWMLPPGDLNTAPQKVDEILASRSRAWFEQRDRRRFLQRVAFWSRTETTPAKMLSGAVLAIRSADFDELGGFDERFPLYFEETDFLRRVSESRRRIAYVPRARVRHLYNQSAAQVADEAAARYARSELRYLEKWNGPFLARALKRVERPLPAHDARDLIADELELDRDDLVIEASPLASFTTAAGHFPQTRRISIPPEVRASMHGDFYLRAVVRATGEIVGTYRIRP